MTQEEKQLLLKDICARLPYNVIINCEGRGIKYKCFLTTDILNEILLNQEYYDYKPYLRPMSSMTEEEWKEYRPLCNNVLLMRYSVSNHYPVTDWLLAHHLDFRRLIEKGLAIEAPDDMY